ADRRAARHHAPGEADRPHRGQARAGLAGGGGAARAGRHLERQRRQARGPREAGVRPAARAAQLIAMNALEQMGRAPIAALEFANIVLTERDAQIAVTPKDVVWTHRTTTLYRYRSSTRSYAVPVLLVFALINRPD